MVSLRAKRSSSPLDLVVQILVALTLVCPNPSYALQFDLHAGARRCFFERIPADTRVRVGVTVVDSLSTIPVAVRVARPGSHDVLYASSAAEDERFSFRTSPAFSTPRRLDLRHESPGWRKVATKVRGSKNRLPRGHGPPPSIGERGVELNVSNNNGSTSVDDRRYRIGIDEATEQDSYSFCFVMGRESRTQRLLAFSRAAPSRRILFDLSIGTSEVPSASIVAALAKERHLNDSEAQFKAVRTSVLGILRGLNEMQAEATQSDDIARNTSGLVSLYSLLSCAVTIVSSLYSAAVDYASVQTRERPT
jgi:hypothetical protein